MEPQLATDENAVSLAIWLIGGLLTLLGAAGLIILKQYANQRQRENEDQAEFNKQMKEFNKQMAQKQETQDKILTLAVKDLEQQTKITGILFKKYEELDAKHNDVNTRLTLIENK